MEITAEKQLTFGEKLVGINFNPSKDTRVDRAKEICAELADIVYSEMSETGGSGLKAILAENTYGEILNAQMNVVKLLTLKY